MSLLFMEQDICKNDPCLHNRYFVLCTSIKKWPCLLGFNPSVHNTDMYEFLKGAFVRKPLRLIQNSRYEIQNWKIEIQFLN